MTSLPYVQTVPWQPDADICQLSRAAKSGSIPFSLPMICPSTTSISHLGMLFHSLTFPIGRSALAHGIIPPFPPPSDTFPLPIYSARTYWHHHEGGQFLHVLAGSGWICDKGGRPQKITVGDVIWCPPGTTHWHGADDASYMVHQAVSHGKLEWRDEVGDEEYGQKK